MNPKTTLILVVVLLLAGAAYLLTSRSSGPANPGKTGQDDRDELVFEKMLEEVEIDSIVVDQFGDGGDFALERKQNLWRVSVPHEFPARTSATNELLTELSGLQGFTISPRGMPADAPTIYLNRGQDPVVITLGQRLGADRAVVFVKVGQLAKTAYNTRDALHDFIDAFDPASYYAKKISVPLLTDIQRITFDTPDGTSSLSQRNDQWWIGTDAAAERALTDDVDQHPGIAQLFAFLETIELIEMQDRFTPLAAYGLEKPLITMTLTGQSAEGTRTTPLEIRVGVPADPEDKTRFISVNYAEERRPAVFTVATPQALLIGQSAVAFRDPRIIATPPPLIASISLTAPQGERTRIELFTNKPPVLRLANDEEKALSRQKVAALLQTMNLTRAIEHVADESVAGAKLMTALITPRLDAAPESLTIYTDENSSPVQPTVLVRRGDEAVALRVPRTTVAELLDPELLVASPR